MKPSSLAKAVTRLVLNVHHDGSLFSLGDAQRFHDLLLVALAEELEGVGVGRLGFLPVALRLWVERVVGDGAGLLAALVGTELERRQRSDFKGLGI